HLSVIDVKEGEKVRRGTPIGRTGQTGLAGGDHLNFTMLLAGLPIDPRKWWDPHWIQDRLERKLEQALPFQDWPHADGPPRSLAPAVCGAAGGDLPRPRAARRQ